MQSVPRQGDEAGIEWVNRPDGLPDVRVILVRYDPQGVLVKVAIQGCDVPLAVYVNT